MVVILALLLALFAASSADAQVFPIPPTAQIVTLADNANRLLGKVTFISPQHIICDSGCAAGAPGQQTMANSSPVVIASDQVVPVDIDGQTVFAEPPFAVTGDTLSFLNDTATLTGPGVYTFNIPAGLVGTIGFEVATNATSGWTPVGAWLTDGTYATSVSSFPIQGSFTVAGAYRFTVTAYTSGSTNFDVHVYWMGQLPVGVFTNLAAIKGVAISSNTGTRDAGTQRVTIATNDVVPVTGTFWQATQPVSGTFFQATQPVSIATAPALVASSAVIGHVIADTGSTTAVTGTVNVSQQAAVNTSTTLQSAAVANGNGTLMTTGGMARAILTVNCAACAGGTGVLFEGTEDGTNFASLVSQQLGVFTTSTFTSTAGVTMWSLPVAGLVSVRARIFSYSAGTITVTGHVTPVTDIATWATVANVAGSSNAVSLNNVNGGTANAFNVGAAGATTLRVIPASDSTTAVTQATGTNLHAVLDTTSTTAVTQATAANLNATVTNLTLTKGTQGATGVSSQDLKDAGRNMTNYFMAAPIITTTAEVMQSFTGYKGGIAVAANVSPAVVTTAKTYRIQSIEVHYWAATVIGGARINLRANLTGAGVVGSPLVKSWEVGIPAIFTAGSAMSYVFEIPDGMEFPAGTGIAVGVIGEGADGTTGTITGKVLIAINGYEY